VSDERFEEMAQVERAAENRKDERKAAKEARKWQGISGRAGGSSNWTEVDGQLVTKAAAVVGSMGGAIRLGYTRDGGAFAVGIYGDGNPFTEYYHDVEEIEDFLRRVIETYE